MNQTTASSPIPTPYSEWDTTVRAASTLLAKLGQAAMAHRSNLLDLASTAQNDLDRMDKGHGTFGVGSQTSTQHFTTEANLKAAINAAAENDHAHAFLAEVVRTGELPMVGLQAIADELAS